MKTLNEYQRGAMKLGDIIVVGIDDITHDLSKIKIIHPPEKISLLADIVVTKNFSNVFRRHCFLVFCLHECLDELAKTDGMVLSEIENFL